jgi:hypothetical protein
MNLRTRAAVMLAAGALLTAGAGLAAAPGAVAATPGCTLVPLTLCGSWNAEVPGLPDLDVAGDGPGVSGQAIIVYTRTNHDPAEDFELVPELPTDTSTYTVGPWTTATALGFTDAVSIAYAPHGVQSGFCVSTVNPNGNTAVQLRRCNVTVGKFNPFQTYRSGAALGDGTFVSFREVINTFALTDPRNSGSIGVIGHRVHVITRAYTGTSGQLWGQNGA